MRHFVILLILTSILTIKSHASCTACWEMKYVEIETTKGQLIHGYVKWNKVWFGNFGEKANSMDIPTTFPENFQKYYQNWKNGVSKIKVYKKLHKIGDNEKWSGYVLTEKDILEIKFKEIVSIKKVVNQVDNISGAQELTILTIEAIKLFENKPYHVDNVNDGCRFYFLNFNKNFAETEFKKFVKENMFRNPEKLVENSIVTVKKCFD